MTRFVVVGEALVDVVPSEDGVVDRPGGSPANVALALGRLGRDVRLITTLAPDARGQLVRAWLADGSVEITASAPVGGRTSVAGVTLDASGGATYAFDLSWDLPAADTSDASVLHVGSIATVLEPGAEVVLDAVRRAQGHALVSFDPNARPAITPERAKVLPRVAELVALADVVKVSDEDLDWYFPGVDALEAAQAWAATGPAIVVVTHGSRGASVVRSGGGLLRIPGRTVEVADAVGAGDSFMGALLDGLAPALPLASWDLRALDDATLQSAAHRAAVAAAITVSRPGADPPTRAELEAAHSV